MTSPGKVYLVGAGPGDPELITVRGLRCLQRADVVLYDRLIHPDLLEEVPSAALRVPVGKAPGNAGVGQEGIHQLLIAHARRSAVVVRLKGGDPFVFGRGSEEAMALNAAGIPWEVVPAVSSAFGVPARASIPLTHRGVARGFAVVTGHQLDGELDWPSLAAADTLVVLMGVAALPRITDHLIAHGRSPSTPAALIERGTTSEERVTISTLEDIAARASAEQVRSPATFVVGEVVALRESLLTAADIAAADSAAAEFVTAQTSSGSSILPFPVPPTDTQEPFLPASTRRRRLTHDHDYDHLEREAPRTAAALG